MKTNRDTALSIFLQIIYGQYRSTPDLTTPYGLESQGFELRWGQEIFLHTRPDRPWSPHSLLYNAVRGSFPGVKRPEQSCGHPPPTGANLHI